MAVSLRIYKAVHTGIIYDEVYTIWNFTHKFDDALTLYKNPNNNHVINSILIHLDRFLFPGQEYYYRFHTIFFGALYCVSMVYLVRALISSRPLQVGFIVLLTVQWFVFDLSFLARGYSIALGSVFGGLAMLVFLVKRKIPFSRIWLPLSILTAMNFLAFGSMLSVLLMLFVVNGTYILFFSHRVFVSNVKPFKAIIVHIATVSIGSGLLLYWLYRSIYRDILAARDDFGSPPLTSHLREVLWDNMLAGTQTWAKGVYLGLLLLTAAAIAYAVFLLIKTRRREGITYLNLNTPQALIILTAVMFFAGAFIYRNVLELSLGYPRNGVFMIPLFLLSCGILLDVSVALIDKTRLRYIVVTVVCVVTLLTAAAARPSLHAVNVSTWEIQSLAGVLLRDLKKIDPYRQWKVALTQQTWHMNLPLQHYQLTGEPIRQTGNADADVIVVHLSESVSGTAWYKEGFYDRFDCKIGFSPAVSKKYHLVENKSD